MSSVLMVIYGHLMVIENHWIILNQKMAHKNQVDLQHIVSSSLRSEELGGAANGQCEKRHANGSDFRHC